MSIKYFESLFDWKKPMSLSMIDIETLKKMFKDDPQGECL